MDRVRSLEMLVRAAETGSFARAAATLGVTPSAVSHGIAELERRLGTPLVHRTTRRLHLTEAGEAACRCGREVLERLRQLDEVGPEDSSRQLRGLLRVGMGSGVGRSIIGPRLGPFLARHPELQLELLSQYRISEMHEAGIDLLLRAEDLPDSSLVARRLGHIRHAVYAAPGYLGAMGTPQAPEDLVRHRCLVHKPPQLPRAANEWRFTRGAENRVVRVPTTVTSDDREILVAMALGGAGIIRIGMIELALVTSGMLVRLLPGWSLPDGPPLHALYRKTPRVSRNVAGFLEFVSQALAEFDPGQDAFVHSSIGS